MISQWLLEFFQRVTEVEEADSVSPIIFTRLKILLHIAHKTAKIAALP